MNESRRTGLLNLATEFSRLRYPNFNLEVNCSNPTGIMKCYTFVHNKDKYVFEDFSFETLEHFKNRFLEMCKMNKDNYIFNKENSIY